LTLTPPYPPIDQLQSYNGLPDHHRPYLQPLPTSSASTIQGSATVVNGVDVSGIGNGGGTAEGFIFDPEIASLIHQLWQDLVIPKIMDCISEFYLMDSAS